MLSFASLLTCFLCSRAASAALIDLSLLAPTVDLSYAKVVGSSLLGVDSFKGIPYAQPPVGNLRLKPPQPINTNLGTVYATGVPTACPQFFSEVNTGSLPADTVGKLLNNPLVQNVTAAGEDCLTINVQRPSNATPTSKLPVVFWMFGGGFEFGSTQSYDGSGLIATSSLQGKEIIFVAVNYRIGGFGFMPGAEILKDGSSNLGLLDQRLGLQWVADNIAKFGGDPAKVTIWGESAGSISVLDQMILYSGNNTYKGKPLFRGAIMNSGSIVPADPVDCPKGQVVYNSVVSAAGCSGSADTLSCLRKVSYETFLNAVSSVPAIFGYNSVALSYLPRPDGTVLTASPEILMEAGSYTKIPFIIGDQEDEGTLFALSQSNITTTAQLEAYLLDIFFHDATPATIAALVATYPDDASAGSPFRTGAANELYPQFKRLAAILGDLTFILSRRAFLAINAAVTPSLPSWSYLATYNYGLPILGTFHASDILPAYGIEPGFPSVSIQSYYLSFINTLDPNKGTSGPGLIQWPQWGAGQQLLNFGALTNSLLVDDFRNASYQFLAANTAMLHI